MEQHSSKLMQHLGIIAGVCKEVRLAELIDQQIENGDRKVSVGEAVVAMVLNAMGFTGRPLYLTPRFYESRPVGTLVREGLSSDDFHDYSLGTALDSLYEHGITEVFFSVASQILKAQGIETRFAHLDSTSFSVYGEYNDEDEEPEEGVIHITKGYSKDNAPELNQVVAQMISVNKTSLPLWIEALSGNSNDKKAFKETVKKFQKQFERDEMPYIVVDSAFYTKENIAGCSEELRWVSRVPESIKDTKDLYRSLSGEKMEPIGGGYWYTRLGSEYAGVPQRWLLIFSEKAYEREIKTFERKLEKELEKKGKELKHLRNTAYACAEDAEKAAQAFSRKLKHVRFDYHVYEKPYYEGKGRPKAGSAPSSTSWFIEGSLAYDEQRIEADRLCKGKFIVATNELDEKILSDRQIIEVYKDQNVSVERGFRFLKDPLFYADRLFLKKPERVMSLIMIMTISLLVYSLAERRTRAALKEKGTHIWDQKNRPTDRPTARWVFTIFEDVLLLYTRSGKGTTVEAMNLRDEHKIILNSLGEHYRKMYFL
jgi:transposase